MSETQRYSLYYGVNTPLPEQVELFAGLLRATFVNGDLRWIKYGDREVVRRIYLAVRDEHWGTATNEITNLKLSQSADTFHITYDAVSRLGEIAFEWHALIRGSAEGLISYEIDGIAETTFLSNRIGLCVLHPMAECAGAACVVIHDDGSREEGYFPTDIAPHQPFKDIRAISYGIVEGIEARIGFSGEVFEMEDQRNWTDASFKTYCTPLSRPIPQTIQAGTKIVQSATVTLIRTASHEVQVSRDKAQDGVILHLLHDHVTKLPRIGLCASGNTLSAVEVDWLRALHLDHLRTDLHLNRADYADTLQRASDEAKACGTRLQIALHLADDGLADMQHLLKEVLPHVKPDIASWLILHEPHPVTSEAIFEQTQRLLRAYDADALIGAGTDSNFTELNRNRPRQQLADFIAYSINPQVHAFDCASMVETLPTQAITVRCAREIAGNADIYVGPVTLRPRQRKALAKPTNADPRQRSLFGAAWTLGSLKYLSEGGATNVTLYETSGPNGVTGQCADDWAATEYPAQQNCVYPLFHVIEVISSFGDATAVQCISSDPLAVDAMLLRNSSQTRLIVANFSGQQQLVRMQTDRQMARIRMLDQYTFAQAAHEPQRFRTQTAAVTHVRDGELKLELLPYGIAFVDLMP